MPAPRWIFNAMLRDVFGRRWHLVGLALARMTHPKQNNSGKSFFNSAQWHRLRFHALVRDMFRCVICGTDISGMRRARVDHIKPRSTHPEIAYDLDNLRSLCADCDNQSHREKNMRGHSGERVERIRGFDRHGAPLDPNYNSWRPR